MRASLHVNILWGASKKRGAVLVLRAILVQHAVVVCPSRIESHTNQRRGCGSWFEGNLWTKSSAFSLQILFHAQLQSRQENASKPFQTKPPRLSRQAFNANVRNTTNFGCHKRNRLQTIEFPRQKTFQHTSAISFWSRKT